jgi:hypothetical protein
MGMNKEDEEKPRNVKKPREKKTDERADALEKMDRYG